MSFIAKTDYFGLGSADLVCTDSADNASASVLEKAGQDGMVIAHEVYGQTAAPSCTYKVKAATTLSVTLGLVTAVGGTNYALTNFKMSTAAGAETTVTASGEQVEADVSGVAACLPWCETVSVAVTPCKRAKLPASTVTVGGTGCSLAAADLTLSCTLLKTTVNGACVAHDVADGRAELELEIVQTGDTAPTVAPEAASGWYVSSPPASSNPDEDYPTWRCKLTKHLARAAAAPSSSSSSSSS